MENPNDAGLIFYPAYCFKASPTHFAWVKMALVDVHMLQRRKGFEGEFYFFHLVDARSLSKQYIILFPFQMTEWTILPIHPFITIRSVSRRYLHSIQSIKLKREIDKIQTRSELKLT